MKTLATLTLILIVTRCVYGLDCFNCGDSNYDGENGLTNDCWVTVSTTPGATSSVSCFSASGVTEYCKTSFTIKDGVTTSVSRGCAYANSDHNSHTDGVPSTNCITTLDTSSNPTDTTECYYSCSANKCNTKKASALMACSTNCSTPKGACDYITGTCVCNTGYSGSDCSKTTVTTTLPKAMRKCVQCNSETDSTCSSTRANTDCPGTEEYCSTAYTYIYDSSDSIVKTVVSRGCTASMKAVDECAFTAIYTDPPINNSPIPGYNEFTCYSTCDTDGCNTNTANGVIDDDETIDLHCVQCSDTTGSTSCNTATTRTICPSGSTHCKSTVRYLISEKMDRKYTTTNPAYKLRSVVRECATASVPPSCTKIPDDTAKGLKKVTCVETCQEDGCNTGWPSRPKCIQCSSSIRSDGYDECLENPPDADDCDYPYEAHCVIVDQGIEKDKLSGVTGYPRRMTRGCSSYSFGTSCSSDKIRSTTVESCNRTCSTDGCNVGSGGVVPAHSMVSVILSVLFGWLLQVYG